MKNKTWSLVSKLFSPDFQSKKSIVHLIWSEFTCLKYHTVLKWWRINYFISCFVYILWWWQFECEKVFTPESVTISGWDVNIKSMVDFEFLSIWFGYFIICNSLKRDVRKQKSEPSKLVESFVHQSLYFLLKSSIMAIMNGF